jgi:hypothetical protein
MLLSLFTGDRRFLLRYGAADGAIALAVWGSEVSVLFGGQTSGANKEEGEGTPALKVTYRVQEEGETAGGRCEHEHEGHGHEAVPPAGEALELTLPLEEWHAVRACVVSGWIESIE